MASDLSRPITELANDLTAQIDIASPSDILSILKKCDQEIFDGWQGHPNLFDERIQSNLQKITQKAVSILKNPGKGAIVLSGCGTSGRMAFLTCRNFNAALEKAGLPPCFHYTMAGKDKALFTSQEAVEDNSHVGREMLIEASQGKSEVLLIGISCGLSAPFVAGQIDHCLQNTHVFTPVLMGFNPAHLARNMPVENWDKTLLQVVDALVASEEKGKGFLLNPIVGPEPITGSSRMKGGSATKMMLDAIFLSAISMALHQSQPSVPALLKAYEGVCESVYQSSASTCHLLQAAGDSLSSGGHLYYAGFDSLGIMGMIDASECPPTFGATLDDVRGFLHEGYVTLGNLEGDLSKLGHHYQISLDDFKKTVLPSLTKSDFMIFLVTENDQQVDKNVELPCRTACVCIQHEQTCTNEEAVVGTYNHATKVMLPSPQIADLPSEVSPMLRALQSEMAAKWVLNAISTGAHVLNHKVYGNLMVDVKVSNNKLYHRAIGIVQRLGGVSEVMARELLLKVIYDTETLTPDLISAPVSQHVCTATPKPKVVPTALVAAIGGCSLAKARQLLARQPVVRNAMALAQASMTAQK